MPFIANGVVCNRRWRWRILQLIIAIDRNEFYCNMLKIGRPNSVREKNVILSLEVSWNVRFFEHVADIRISINSDMIFPFRTKWYEWCSFQKNLESPCEYIEKLSFCGKDSKNAKFRNEKTFTYSSNLTTYSRLFFSNYSSNDGSNC